MGAFLLLVDIFGSVVGAVTDIFHNGRVFSTGGCEGGIHSLPGGTIEEDGSTNDGGSKTRYQYQTKDEYTRYDQAKQQQQQRTTVNPQFKVHTMGCSSGILMTLLILGGILALFFFLLPTFIIFAAIGAVVVFFLRLFM